MLCEVRFGILTRGEVDSDWSVVRQPMNADDLRAAPGNGAEYGAFDN